MEKKFYIHAISAEEEQLWMNSAPTEIGASVIAYRDSTFQYFPNLLKQHSSKSGILLTIKYYVENLKCFSPPINSSMDFLSEKKFSVID